MQYFALPKARAIRVQLWRYAVADRQQPIANPHNRLSTVDDIVLFEGRAYFFHWRRPDRLYITEPNTNRERNEYFSIQVCVFKHREADE